MRFLKALVYGAPLLFLGAATLNAFSKGHWSKLMIITLSAAAFLFWTIMLASDLIPLERGDPKVIENK